MFHCRSNCDSRIKFYYWAKYPWGILILAAFASAGQVFPAPLDRRFPSCLCIPRYLIFTASCSNMTSWTSFYCWARAPQRDLILTAGRVFSAPLGSLEIPPAAAAGTGTRGSITEQPYFRAFLYHTYHPIEYTILPYCHIIQIRCSHGASFYGAHCTVFSISRQLLTCNLHGESCSDKYCSNTVQTNTGDLLKI